MNYHKLFRNTLHMTSLIAILLVATQDVFAQMPVRPMPGSPGPQPGQPIRPMPGTPVPQPYPQPAPAPYPQPAPIPMPPQPAPYPSPYPSPGQVRSSLSVTNITRRSGGEWKQILLNPQVIISNLEIRASMANLMVHEAQLVDQFGNSSPISSLGEMMINSGFSDSAFALESFGNVAAINLRVESYGGVADLEVTTTSNDFTQLNLRDLTPIPAPAPAPNPAPQPSPQPAPGGSLTGYCQDFDHSQFTAAKSFAYSTSGLDMNSNDSVNWALNYNQTHACGTITEYVNRHKALYDLAYSTSGLDMTSAEAKAYANDRVEYQTVFEIQANRQTLVAIKNFAYSTSGLDYTSVQAQEVARLWIDRGNCGDTNLISSMSSEYKRQYTFAYSSSGLNYNSQEARNYAVRQIQNFSICTDLFRF